MASDARLVSVEGTAAALPPQLGRSWGLLVDAGAPELHDPSSNTHGLSLQSYVFPPGFRATGYHSLNSQQPQCQAGASLLAPEGLPRQVSGTLPVPVVVTGPKEASPPFPQTFRSPVEGLPRRGTSCFMPL